MSQSPSLDMSQVQLAEKSPWKNFGPLALIIGAICLVGAYFASTHDVPGIRKFWTAYLTAFMFAMSLGVGGLFFVIIQHLTRAGWSITVRRIAEHMMMALPFIALFGLPLVIGGGHHEAGSDHVSFWPASQHLYEWTHSAVVENDVMLKAKAPYLNSDFGLLRYLFYIAVWTALSAMFWRRSTKQDLCEAGSEEALQLSAKMRWMAPISLLLFAITTTFAAFDLLMSLDPHWFSTIFGVYFFSGSALTTHAFLVIFALLLQRSGYLKGIVTPEHYHDLGKYMFGFTVFWAYIGFSQYFLIWYANIPEETGWFSYRGHGGWMTLSLVLVFGRFVLPFFILLRRPLKRMPSLLVLMAIWVVVMEFVDMYWLVQPAYAHHLAHYFHSIGDHSAAEQISHHVDFSIVDVLSLVGFAGLFLGALGMLMRNKALVPIHDPRLQDSIGHENF